MEIDSKADIRFFGKITASITHELQNVLAIIQESTGLMGDQLIFYSDKPENLRIEIEKSLNLINKQLTRGSNLLTHLNRFAHSPDKTHEEIDLYEVIEQVAVLSHRFVSLKQVSLVNQIPNQSTRIATNRVLLQKGLFQAIECCLDFLAPGGQINVKLEKETSRFLIRMLYDGNLSNPGSFTEILSNTELWKALCQTLIDLNGSAEFDVSGKGIVLSLEHRQ